DMLDLEIDPAAYLPSDDSTSGFDNIAGALGLSSTLVEAYVTAAQKISRLAIGEAEAPTLKVYRTPEDTSQDYHVEGLPFGTRGGRAGRSRRQRRWTERAGGRRARCRGGSRGNGDSRSRCSGG